MMGPQVHLDARLGLVASLVPEGVRAADVGCDHAQLPIALIQSGTCLSVIASDLREGPLASARDNVRRAGLTDRIALRRSDGLDQFSPGEADCVVMAGMGGILITQLIARADWLRSPEVCLVLQPMSDAHLVRKTLWESGFAIEDERAAVAHRRVYSALRARYCGKAWNPEPVQCYAGLLPHGGASERLRLEREAHSFAVQIDGLARSGREPQRLAELISLRDQLEDLISQMKVNDSRKDDAQ